MDRLFQVLVLEGLGVGMLLLFSKAFAWWTGFSRSRLPETERLALLPRISVQRNLEELNRYLICSLAVFLFVPVTFICLGPDLTNVASLVFLAGLVSLSAYPAFCVLRLRRACTLDLRAELEVAKELRLLESEGCRIFHNFPARSDWSIDHIVISYSGIYAIETMTEHMRRNSRGKKESEVIFDGMHLHFNRYTDSDALGQARRSASELSWELSSVANELVEIKAVLVIPGCRVKRNGPSEVAVVDPDELRILILKTGEPQLTDAQIKTLAVSIENKLHAFEDEGQTVAAA